MLTAVKKLAIKKNISRVLSTLLIAGSILPTLAAPASAAFDPNNPYNGLQANQNPLPTAVWLSPSDDTTVVKGVPTWIGDAAHENGSGKSYNLKSSSSGPSRIALYKFNVANVDTASSIYFKVSIGSCSSCTSRALYIYGTKNDGIWKETDLNWNIAADPTGLNYFNGTNSGPAPVDADGNVVKDLSGIALTKTAVNNVGKLSDLEDPITGKTAAWLGYLKTSTSATTDNYIDVTQFVKKFGQDGYVTFFVVDDGFINQSTSVYNKERTGSVDHPGNTQAPQLILVRNNYTDVPYGLTVKAGYNSAILSWNPSSDVNVTNYKILRGTAVGGPYTPLKSADGTTDLLVTSTSPTGPVTFTDTSVLNGSTYYYVIQGVKTKTANYTTIETTPRNISITADINYTSNEVSVIPIGEPQNPTAVPANKQVTLNWTAPPGVYSFVVKRGTSPGDPNPTRITVANDTKYLDTGVVNDKTYYYVVISLDSKGNEVAGASTAEISATPASIIAPVLTVTPGNKKAYLSWNTVQDATYYTVYRDSGDGFKTVATVTYTTYMDAGLINGKLYPYQVTAHNGPIKSKESDAFGITPQDLVKPVIISATPGDQSVKLTWGTVAGAVYYNVKRSSPTNSGYQKVGTVTGTTYYTDTGLTNGITYYYMINAADSDSEGPYSDEINSVPIPLPAKPAGLTLTVSVNQISLSWSTITGATYYNVNRSLAGGSNNTVIKVIGTNYLDTDVTPGTTYTYVVTAVNAAGEGPGSDQVSGKTAVPAAPTGLGAKAETKQVKLTWTTSTGATSYNVKRSSVSGGPYTTVGTSTTGSYNDTIVVQGRTYYYVVTAVNGSGESVNSSQVIVNMPEDTPIGGGYGPVTVIVDKKQGTRLDATPVIEKIDGNNYARVVIDSDSLTKALDGMKDADANSQKVTVEIANKDAGAKLDLPAKAIADGVKKAKNAVLSIKTGDASYDLPLNLIDVTALAKTLGVDPKDMKLSVTIEKVTGKLKDDLTKNAIKAGVGLIGNAIDFTITAEAKDKKTNVSSFGTTYVSRTILLPKTVEQSKSTVVLYDPKTGEMSFVPATFANSKDASEVTIKRTGNSIYTVVEYSKTFTDTAKHWAKADIELLASKLIVKGTSDSQFSPDNQITRAEFAALLVRSLGLTEEVTNNFSDVSDKEWYAGAVGAAAKAGLVTGVEKGKYAPNDNITREQMAVMINNALKIAGKEVKLAADKQDQTLAKFDDSKSISTWAKDAVAQSISAGLISGATDKTFVPATSATRAEATTMLKRLLQYVNFIN